MSDLTAHSIVIEDIKDWRGQDVIDSQGEKLGKHITLVQLAGATAGQP